MKKVALRITVVAGGLIGVLMAGGAVWIRG
jgi:hypothetical protein